MKTKKKLISFGSIIGVAGVSAIATTIVATNVKTNSNTSIYQNTSTQQRDGINLAHPLQQPVPVTEKSFTPRYSENELKPIGVNQLTYQKSVTVTYFLQGIDVQPFSPYDAGESGRGPIDASGTHISDHLRATKPPSGNWWSDDEADDDWSAWNATLTFKNSLGREDKIILHANSGHDTHWFGKGNHDYSLLALLPNDSSQVKNGKPTLFGVPIDLNFSGVARSMWSLHTGPQTIITSRDGDNGSDEEYTGNFFRFNNQPVSGHQSSPLRNGESLNNKWVSNFIAHVINLLKKASIKHETIAKTSSIQTFMPIVTDHKPTIADYKSQLVNKDGNKITFVSDASNQPNTMEIADGGFKATDKDITIRVREGLGARAHSKTGLSEWKNITIPYYIFDPANIMYVDRTQGQAWDYSSGTRKYYSQPPKLRLRWNKHYFEAVDAWVKAESLKKRLSEIPFTSPLHKNQATDLINSHKLTDENFEEFKQNYANRHEVNSTLLTRPAIAPYLHHVSEYTREIIGNLLKTSTFNVEIRDTIDALKKKTYTFHDLSKPYFDVEVPTTWMASHPQKQWNLQVVTSITTKDGKDYKFHLDRNPENESSKVYADEYKISIESNPSHLKWSFFLQSKPEDLNQDVSWVGLRTGNKMDDQFRLLQGHRTPLPSSWRDYLMKAIDKDEKLAQTLLDWEDGTDKPLTPSMKIFIPETIIYNNVTIKRAPTMMLDLTDHPHQWLSILFSNDEVNFAVGWAFDLSAGTLIAFYKDNLDETLIEWDDSHLGKIDTNNTLPPSVKTVPLPGASLASSVYGQDDSDYGWKGATYPWDITKHQEDANKKLYISKKNGEWIVPSEGDRKLADVIGHAVDPKKINYIFGEELQLVVNPYASSPNWSATDYGSATPKYGIRQVWDEVDGHKKILEDWEDGRWNHLMDQHNHATTDGIFGSDINGVYDSFASFGPGHHKVGIDIFDTTALVTSFSFEVDTTPPELLTAKSPLPVTETKLNGAPMFVSHGPLDLNIKDSNLKDLQAEFKDSHGQWYSFPIHVSQKIVHGQIVSEAHTILNYQGLVKLTASDWAGNSQTWYVYLLAQDNPFGLNTLWNSNDHLLHPPEDEKHNQLVGVYRGAPVYVVGDTSSGSTYFQDHDETHSVTKIQDQTGHVIKPLSSTAATTAGDHLDKALGVKYGQVTTKDSNTITRGYVGDELKPFLSKFNTSSSDTPTPMYEIPKDTLIYVESWVNGVLKPYYLWVSSKPLDQVEAPFTTDASSHPSTFDSQTITIGATATPEVIAGRDATKQAEKEAFFALIAWKKLEASLKLFDATESLDAKRNEVAGYIAASTATKATLEKATPLTKLSLLNQELQVIEKSIEDHWYQSHPSGTQQQYDAVKQSLFSASPEWVAKQQEITTLMKTAEYQQAWKELDEFNLNFQKKLDFMKEEIKHAEVSRKELEGKVNAAKAKYDLKKQAWKDSLVFLEAQYQKTMATKDVLRSAEASGTPYLYSLNSLIESGRLGYVSHHTQQAITDHLSDVKGGDGGIIHYSPLGAQDSSSESYKYGIRLDATTHRWLTLADGMNLTSKEGGAIYDGPMIWNGAELEDYDHLINKQEMFVEKDPNVDPEKLWNLMEKYNEMLSKGVEVPMDPHLVQQKVDELEKSSKTNTSSSTSGANVGVVLGAIFGSLAIIGATGGLYIYRKKSKKVI